jgi:hypothetical protein
MTQNKIPFSLIIYKESVLVIICEFHLSLKPVQSISHYNKYLTSYSQDVQNETYKSNQLLLWTLSTVWVA